MYIITKEEAQIFWEYYTLTSSWEFSCYLAMPKIFEGVDNLYNDEVAKKYAKFLSPIINNNHPTEDSEGNKKTWIMDTARAYANYLADFHNNEHFLNPGSFYLLCTIIAKGVN